MRQEGVESRPPGIRTCRVETGTPSAEGQGATARDPLAGLVHCLGIAAAADGLQTPPEQPAEAESATESQHHNGQVIFLPKKIISTVRCAKRGHLYL